MAEFVNLSSKSVAQRVLRAARALLADHVTHSDLQGFVVGYKTVQGVRTSSVALIVLVDRKRLTDQPAPVNPLVPPSGVADAAQFLRDESFSGLQILLDVQAVGKLSPHNWPNPSLPRTQLRPAYPGISAAHVSFPGAGTLGAWLKDEGGNFYILSNNHVLALETGYQDGKLVGFGSRTANPGDLIVQPGDEPPRTTQASDVIASLTDFIPLYYDGVTIPVVSNFSDVAIARVLEPGMIDPSIPLLGQQGNPIEVSNFGSSVNINDIVLKVGRTTGATQATVTEVNVLVTLPYDSGFVTFCGLCLTSAMSLPGDSGSLIIGMDGMARGILVGGSDQVSVFCDVLPALRTFGQKLNSKLALA
jgi:hypothetical protein